MNLLFIGDIVGKPGRVGLLACLGELIRRYRIDFTIANAENAAGGMGITKAVAEELLAGSINVLTTGNHVWKQKEAAGLLEAERRVLRPANYPPGVPGRGTEIYTTEGSGLVGVLNLMGRTFMQPIDCPFHTADREIETLRRNTNVIIVDMHAEATSEKQAMGWYLDGRVSAVLGTHTHVQTADERLLPEGTAYITDLGMTGPRDSALGINVTNIITRFLTGMPVRFELAPGPVIVSGVMVNIDTENGKARSITRVNESVQTQE